MDPRIGHQVCLELGQVHVEGSVEAQRRSDARHQLPDEPVEVRVRRAADLESLLAQVVDGLVVHHERDVHVLHGRVRMEDGVVRLDHGRWDLSMSVRFTIIYLDINICFDWDGIQIF